jgi:hypothetical protein
MRLFTAGLFAVILSVGAMAPLSAANAQLDIVVRVDVEPPPLPVYDQPPIPEPGYLWVPGYWAWDDDVGYYWVPGTWVLPPESELLWTPGYWGWDDGLYLFHPGYWGRHIGFYGGVVYGFGYDGVGYEGGYWRDRRFFYNRTVNNISNVSITNVYSKTVIVHNTTNVSYNGGGGTTARPTSGQLAAEKEHHVPPTAVQTHHVELAAKDPSLSLNANHGHPTVAATAHPAVLNGPGVVAAKPGKPVAAIEPKGHSGPNIGRGPTNNPPGTAPGAPSGKTIEEKRPPAGGTGGKPPGGPAPEEKKVQSPTVPHPPAPQVAHPPAPPKPSAAPPPPPPKPRAAPPPPPRPSAAPPPPPPKPRAAPPPPPRPTAAPPPPAPKRPPPPPPPKPKCEPGKPCH